MCGIAGVAGATHPADGQLVERMCEEMRHRGPDAAGMHVAPEVVLGMRRLSIIDRQGGQQPLSNEDESVWAVMNGEIYNHDALRKDLAGRGHRFRSRVDTEVLVHLYEDRGDRLVEDLRGMFAFAIWDGKRRRLLCARDRVGKKPLFWARLGSRLVFASELRALIQDPEVPRDVNPRALDAYLSLQYVPDPLSIFSAVRKLPPASTLVVKGGTERVARYWHLDYSKRHDGSREEVEERVLDKLREATRIRLNSEVPLGAFLSGGIDSSAVVAAMATEMAEPVKTFSIGFSDRDYDEVHYARLVAERFGTDHHEFQVEPEAISVMPRLARHFGEPFADPSAIPSFYLAELTRRHVTVALNGDGGDESFIGYGRYVRGQRVGRLDWLPKPTQHFAGLGLRALGTRVGHRARAERVRRLGEALSLDASGRYAMALTAFDIGQRRRLLTPELTAALDGWDAEQILQEAWEGSLAENPVERMADVDIHSYLPGDLLPKVDVTTMASSLEARSPFLDHELMELAAGIPAEWKMKGGSGKLILKSALRGVIPDEVIDRPKMGFGVPLANWFRKELRDLPAERLLDPGSLGRGYFQREEIERLIRDHQRCTHDNSLRLWVLLQLEEWHREVADIPLARA